MGIALSEIGEGLREATGDGSGASLRCVYLPLSPAGSGHPPHRFITPSRGRFCHLFELKDPWWPVFCVYNRFHKYSSITSCATCSTLIRCSICRRSISYTPFSTLPTGAVAPNATTSRGVVQH